MPQIHKQHKQYIPDRDGGTQFRQSRIQSPDSLRRGENEPLLKVPINIRNAIAADMPAIGRIYVAGHQSAYRGAVPQSQLRAMDEGTESAAWGLELNNENAIFLVAENRTPRVVGFAFGGMSSATDAGLAELFVETKYRGRGVASALLTAFAARVLPLGTTLIRGPVARCNARSRAFCAKTGALEAPDVINFPVLANVPGYGPIHLPAIYEVWTDVAGLAAGQLP